MSQRFNRGFTLIELLVVIAIIGILSSVVLASLNTARGKGADAAIKSNIDNMRAQAEIVYDGDGNYSNVCTNTSVSNALNSIAAVGSYAGTVTVTTSGAATTQVVACHSASTTWVIEAPLKSAANIYWCADSTGVSAQRTTAIAAGGTACPAS
jgi:prepilin-type N-terminal cleavage/methylation domain-containing protein